ncbi:MAG: sulfatase [Planctomycetes bacterium]|nr:sulfatase [Planctomycetota bacterium]
MNGRSVVVGIVALGVLGLAILVWWMRTHPEPLPIASLTPAPSMTGLATQPAKKPNIVLISIDAVRPDHLSCYGYAKPTSPNIDRVAAAGVLFQQCRSQAPWTLPSHMSLFTSMLPTDNGVDNLNKVLAPELTTLAQVLRDEGYETAAIVNNGQMRAHWGFDRGFNSWREFEADTPPGACDQLTDRAMEWLKAPSKNGEPYFLFLHYYDAHDPYKSPPAWREKFHTTLDERGARDLAFANRTPEHNITDPAALENLKSAYDAGIAWMDHELGRLFETLPPDTLIVIFSDHGECFEEHGWTLHGATLDEPDIRTALIVRPPASSNVKPARIETPVMLMDAAPTVLALAGVRSHPQFQGVDLSPAWRGGKIAPRLIPSETKAVLEGRYLLGVTAGGVKAVYSLFDGRFELRKLPDEDRDASASDHAAEALFAPLRQWVRGERFWTFRAVGKGDHEMVLHSPDSPLAMFIPAGLDEERDNLEVSPDGRTITWHVYPGAPGTPGAKRKMLLVQTANPDAAIEVDYKHDGERGLGEVHMGDAAAHPGALPVKLDTTLAPSDPLILAPFDESRPGLYIKRHADPRHAARASRVAPMDDETLRQLRSLGYIQ